MSDIEKANAKSAIGRFMTASQMALKPHNLSRDGMAAATKDGATWRWSNHFKCWACVEARA